MGREDQQPDTINVTFMTETNDAIGVSEDGGTTLKWLPKSQIEYLQTLNDEPRVKADGSIDVEVPIWLLKKNGFAGY